MHEKNSTFYVTVQNGYKKIGKKKKQNAIRFSI